MDVFYAKVKRNLEITPLFTVLRQVCHGNWPSTFLELFGVEYLSPSNILQLAVTLLEREERRCGMLLLFVCFELFGKKEIEELLKC